MYPVNVSRETFQIAIVSRETFQIAIVSRETPN